MSLSRLQSALSWPFQAGPASCHGSHCCCCLRAQAPLRPIAVF